MHQPDPAQPLAIDAVSHCHALPFIDYQDGMLCIDSVSADQLVASFGTPLYVYSKGAILAQYHAYGKAFEGIAHQVCYAVKANSNLSVLRLLAEAGSGFDVVSRGELARVLQVTDGKRVVYSGVGKTAEDIHFALQAQIHCFNVEAMSELDLIDRVAGELGVRAAVSIRVNPDVDAKTHPYISTGMKDNKFGLYNAIDAYRHAQRLDHLDIVGIDCHIGSQITEVTPFVDALDKVIEIIDELRTLGIRLQHVDLGGGLGVRYVDEQPTTVADYAQALMCRLQALGLTVYFEPGRNIVANAGVLLTRVDVLKPTESKNFAIVDASMSELIRPALYQSVMAIIPTKLHPTHKTISQHWTVVGSVCESSDVLGHDRLLDIAVGDVLAITGAGAYGFSMASNYNSRPRPAEVLCDAGKATLIRRRESLADLWQHELL